MYKIKKPNTTSIRVNKSYEGERIEQKIQRIVNNKEPITDGAPLIYTDRKDGINPAYDIRTDRWEIAIDAMDKVSGSRQAAREERIGTRTFDTMNETQQKEFINKFPDSLPAKNAQSAANTSDKQ